MREILFRGKPRHSEKWIEGMLTAKGKSIAVIGQFTDNYTSVQCHTNIAVKAETVGQYTGLTDKNGNKIFENDIIRGEYETYIIGFEYGAFGTVDIGHTDVFPFCDDAYGINTKEFEVIGNIHDNPELLEAKDD